jgi:hypothetical protein
MRIPQQTLELASAIEDNKTALNVLVSQETETKERQDSGRKGHENC